ncbi:MAG TPA: hypothetical protein VHT04_12790, partial [Stellaceae bacterium]|nr:hypothetical protein [Stellaceae bacterium]
MGGAEPAAISHRGGTRLASGPSRGNRERRAAHRCYLSGRRRSNGIVGLQAIDHGIGVQRSASAADAASYRSYVPGVDGLRCLAILAVLLFHAGLMRTGWVGVWLFFVVSGFVITRSILADAELDLPAAARFRRFY